MPYQNVYELPDSVEAHVPRHDQEIYKEAFNHAFDEYADPAQWSGQTSREETAHKVAWAAVKRVLEKAGR
jgi:cation transport regulator